MSSSIYSPGRLHMQAYEDRFADESSGSRMSDFSVSSAGDTFRYDGQSLNSQETGYCSPTIRQTRDTTEDARPQTLNQPTESIVKRDLYKVSSPKVCDLFTTLFYRIPSCLCVTLFLPCPKHCDPILTTL